MRAALLLAIFTSTAGAQPPPRRVGLVISGGISLGSYQAGVMFARLKELRARRAEATLELTTGASAGNINTFLTAVAWCDERVDRVALFANPYFDVWVNVGLDRMLPEQTDAASYGPLFRDQLGGAQVVRLGREAARGMTGDAYDTGGQREGLLTRKAFAPVGRYLAERLAGDGFAPDCRVRTAITLTGSSAETLPLAEGDATAHTLRYVVPLTVRGVGGRLAVRNDAAEVVAGEGGCWAPSSGVHPWEACHPSIGRALYLPEPATGVSPLDVLQMVQAASAFPVAFAPLPMTVCRSRGDGLADPACPAGLSTLTRGFIDGGFFDNVPLGAALEIAHDEDLAAGVAVRPLDLLYVDPSLRRGAPRLPADRRRPDGFGAFTRLVSNGWNEARTAELQGLERHCAAELGLDAHAPGTPARRLHCGDRPPPSARRLITVDRFYGITGSLAGSFGAFAHRGFRVYDYLVGVHDGVMSVVHARGCADAACRVAAFNETLDRVMADFDAPHAEAGVEPRRPVLDGRRPATALDVRGFLARLFVYEQRQLDSATAEAFCATAPAELKAVACGDAFARLAHQSLVWALHCVFVELDRRLRASVLTGNLQRRLQRAALESDLDYVLRSLEPYLEGGADADAFAGDRRAWLADVVDRLLRRAIAVERDDQKALGGQGDAILALNDSLLGVDVVDAVQLSRVGAAAALERDDRILDLDAGTTARILGRGWWTPALDLLVPHYVVGDILHGGLQAGISPHVRLRGLRTPGRRLSAVQRLSLALEAGVAVRDDRPVFPDSLFSTRFGVGVGYDPPGRLVDDLDLLYVHTRPLPDWEAAAHGLELNVRVATKLRLGLGTYQLDRVEGLYLTVGVIDWLALLAGIWGG